MQTWTRERGRLARIELFEVPITFVESFSIDPKMENRERTLNEMFAPASATPPTCIVLPATTATQFEIRAATINMLPKFHGFESEQPYIHLNKFLTICQTFKNQNLDEENVKLRLFPLSLEDHAAAWLNSLAPNSITTWDGLSKKFMAKFYPMAKTEKMKDAIRNFRGRPDEEFSQTWERFHDLLVKCPHHGLDKAQLVHFFYRGLTTAQRTLIESMHKGKFMNQTPNQAYDFLVELAENSQNWSSNGGGYEREEIGSRKQGLYEMKTDPDLKNVMASLVNGVNNLSKKFDAFTVMANRNPHQDQDSLMNVASEPSAMCVLCDSSEHMVECCPNLPVVKAEQANAINGYSTFRKPTPNSFSQTYHPDNRFHPNFSYRQSEPIQQQSGGPPGFQRNFSREGSSQYPQTNQALVPQQPYVAPQQPNNCRTLVPDPMTNYSPSVPQQSSSLETMMTDMMKLQQQFIQQQQQTNTAQAQLNQATAQAIAKMEVQLGQLAISV